MKNFWIHVEKKIQKIQKLNQPTNKYSLEVTRTKKNCDAQNNMTGNWFEEIWLLPKGDSEGKLSESTNLAPTRQQWKWKTFKIA